MFGKGTINDAAISLDGSLVAVASSRSVDLYAVAPDGLAESANPQRLGCDKTGRFFVSVALGQTDGGTTLLAAGSTDGKVRFWTIAGATRTASPMVTLNDLDGRSRDWIRSVAFDSKTSVLVAGTDDGVVLAWKLPSEQALTSGQVSADALGTPAEWRHGDTTREEPPLPNAVRSLAFSPGDRRLAVGLRSGKVDILTIAPDGAYPLVTLDTHSSWVRGVAFPPSDGETLVTATRDGAISRWQVARPEAAATQLEPPNDAEATSVAITGSGMVVATFSTGVVKFGAVTGNSLGAAPDRHSDWVRRVAATTRSTSDLVVTASDDASARVWSATAGLSALGQGAAYSSAVSAVAFQPLQPDTPPDQWRLFSGSSDGTISRWQLGGEDPADRLGTPNVAAGVLSLSFSPQQPTLLASGAKDGQLRIWPLAPDGSQSGTTQSVAAHGETDWVRQVAMSPDGRLVATGSDSQRIARVFPLDPGGVVDDHPVNLEAEPAAEVVGVSLATYQDGGTTAQLVATASRDVQKSYLRVWRVDAPTRAVVTVDSTLDIGSVAFSPDGKLLAAGFKNGSIRLWQVEATGRLTEVMPPAFDPASPRGHKDLVLALGWWQSGGDGPPQYLLASGSADTTVRLWSIPAGGQATPLTGQSFDGAFAVTDGHHDWVRSVAFSPDGAWLASGGDDGLVIVHRVPRP